MVGVEKAAILLTTLGPEAAAGVFRHLSEPEVRQLSAAIARLRSIPREQAAAVHEEAWRRLTEREGLLVDGEQFARQMIAAALTGAREERPADKAAQPGGEFLAASLDPVAPAALAQVLGREHPQVIALVLANLRARKAAEVLAALPEDLQPEIAQRIADLQSVPEDLLADVGDVLAGQVQGLGRVAPRAGFLGAKLIADILNVTDEAVEALRVAEALKSDLSAIRLDTPRERGSVTPDLVREVRARLDLAGHSHVQIFVSGGLTPERIPALSQAGADAFGVGSQVSAAPPIDMTMDIREVNGKPLAKRGRIPGRTPTSRLRG